MFPEGLSYVCYWWSKRIAIHKLCLIYLIFWNEAAIFLASPPPFSLSRKGCEANGYTAKASNNLVLPPRFLPFKKCDKIPLSRWGVLNFEQEEQTRSQFWGREQLDEVTGRFEREYPIWKRWATYALTMPIMVGFTAAVLLLMFTVRVTLYGALLASLFPILDRDVGNPCILICLSFEALFLVL